MLKNKNSKIIRVIGFRTCPSIIGTGTTIRTIAHTWTVFMVLVKSFRTSNDTIGNIIGGSLNGFITVFGASQFLDYVYELPL